MYNGKENKNENLVNILMKNTILINAGFKQALNIKFSNTTHCFIK